MVRRQSFKQSTVWPGKPRSKRQANPALPARPVEAADRQRAQPSGGLGALDDIPVPAWNMTPFGMVLQFNQAFALFTGLPTSRHRPIGWKQLVHAEDHQLARSALISSLETKGSFQHQLRLRHPQDGYRWVRLQARWQPAGPGQDAQWIGACIDVHAHVISQQKLREDLDVRTKMLDGSVDCIKFIDLDGRVLRMNRAGCLALGVPVDEVHFGMKWLNLLPPDVHPAGRKAIQQARDGQPARFAGKSIDADGVVQHWDNMLTPIRDEDGIVSSVLCISREVTQQRAVEQQLRIASEIDPMTGLRNRRAFESQIRKLIRKAGQQHAKLGLLLIDLDHFKHINDTLGHPAGDHLLRAVARRLSAQLQSEHVTVSRLGGDEFAILVYGIEHPEQLMHVAQQAAQQLDAPITFDGHFINGGMSIGAAIYPHDGGSVMELMACADTALNDLKAGGRGGVRLFTPSMLKQAELAAKQLGLARMIIRQNLAEPYYQPKVDLASGRVIGLEALLRWHDADGQLQLPAKVNEAFNDYELATGISEMMQTKVFADLASWRKQGLPLVPVSINVTPVEFLRGQFALQLLARMQHYDIAPQWIEIEVTEQMLSSRHAEFIATDLRLLKQHGVTITLDDFGTGHSSFTHLRDYPIDALKIDASFVRRLDVDSSSLAVVKAVIALGALFQVEVIAEGVETDVQRHLLQCAGCRWGQGFLFSQALPANAIWELIPH